ncbi:thioredoxin [Candidatus Dependentiae bacterium]|nr:thioredoxin [Candidatus Dependentiae bacterium]
MIPHITKENFKSGVEESTKPVIIDAYAAWCGPCQHMTPIFEEVAQEHGDAYSFFKLNVDDARDLAAHFGISSIPTFLFIKKGTIVATETGFLSKADLEKKIQTLLS